MRLSEMAARIGAELFSPAGVDPDIKKVAPITTAGDGDVTFVANPDYYQYLGQTKASAVILKQKQTDLKVPQLIAKDPYVAFAKAANLFWVVKHSLKGVSDQAFISPTAKLGQNVTVYPFAVISDGAEIGDNVVLYSGVFIGENAKIGADCVLYANNVIGERCIIGARCLLHAGSVIGADGFGFAPAEGEIVKIPQVGIVRIEDDVELGACCTVDRAAMGETLVKRGTKLDSKVHIGHNAIIGEHCLFSAHTAIAGSAKVGQWVKAGGHSGIAGHLTVGDNVSIGAMSGVIKDAEPGETYMGFPAIPASEWRRRQVYFKKLADYEKRLKDLETRVAAVEKN